MTGTYTNMYDDIVSYTTYDSDEFLAAIPTFVRAAEERVFYFVQLPYFRRSQTGALTSGNAYLQLPSDFLAASSLSIQTASGWVFLLNKDVEFIREVYPDASATGEPYCYAQFDAGGAEATNRTVVIIGPTPDDDYPAQLNYFYRPTSLVDQPTGTWLSLNAYNTLLYGALSEAANWLKKSAGIDGMADDYESRFVAGLAGLKNLGEGRDRKDTYRSGEKRMGENT